MASLPACARPVGVRISLFSYGHANGPIVQQQQHNEARYHKTLAYNIRHLPNPPRQLRVNATGMSRRLQKEFLQNDNVEAFLEKVRGEICNAVNEECGQSLNFIEEQDQSKRGGSEETDQHSVLNAHNSSELIADIDIVVTICCEEGRHRSVAFVEELARRLAVLGDGEDGLSPYWQPTINVIHRDIGGEEECEQALGQNKRSNKGQAKIRQRERREKGNRYTLQLGDDG
ncbi:hypothetical protein EYB26_009394 [Talaromyces marneffei]|uniref:uncharacterized protein n=1 Tax=Talaromyces marneffei TaxID=37727 RepID=UPI0012A9114F|nr:uncharacterized protein EYB26_009394 [Talaromyces marneffei]QGA21683.1 hypothetical protein EYB26_009394 [Talaromyces marneffei]